MREHVLVSRFLQPYNIELRFMNLMIDGFYLYVTINNARVQKEMETRSITNQSKLRWISVVRSYRASQMLTQ